MKESKKYIIAMHCVTDHIQYMAMFEMDDSRVESKKEIIEGTFTKDKSIKGLVNGHEKGLFNAINGDVYIVFTDHSTIKK